jgi:hypothetical protein
MRSISLLLLLLVVPAGALVVRQGQTVTVPAGETIRDDLLISGGTVRVLGTCTGDVVAAGGDVTVEGPVGGNVIIAGGQVTLDGPVAGSLYAAGGSVEVRGGVGRNAAVTGGSLRIARGATVARDLAVSGGSATVDGTVRRHVLAGTGSLLLGSTARVGGNLQSTVAPQIAQGAVVAGTQTVTPAAHRPHRTAVSWVLWTLLTGLGLLAAGLVFTALAPRLTGEAADMLRTHPWGSLLAGFVVLVLVPAVVLVLVVTLLGIPLAVLLVMAYLAALYLAPIIPAVLVGQRVLHGGSLVTALLVGVGLYVLLRLVPVLGMLVTLVAVLIGLGAVVLALQGRTRHPYFARAEPAA